MQFLEIHRDVAARARDDWKVTKGLNEMLLYEHAIALEASPWSEHIPQPVRESN
jgi:hypothetical protein